MGRSGYYSASCGDIIFRHGKPLAVISSSCPLPTPLSPTKDQGPKTKDLSQYSQTSSVRCPQTQVITMRLTRPSSLTTSTFGECAASFPVGEGCGSSGSTSACRQTALSVNPFPLTANECNFFSFFLPFKKLSTRFLYGEGLFDGEIDFNSVIGFRIDQLIIQWMGVGIAENTLHLVLCQGIMNEMAANGVCAIDG